MNKYKRFTNKQLECIKFFINKKISEHTQIIDSESKHRIDAINDIYLIDKELKKRKDLQS